MSATAARSPASTEADQWLARFGEALEQGDAAGGGRAVRDESYWRDLVAFTWNIKTVEGRDGDRGHARAHARAREAARLARRPRSRRAADGVTDRVDRVRDRGGPRLGLLRLIDGKAWTLLTTLDELKGYEEPTRPAPAQGRRARRQPGARRHGSRSASARPRSSATPSSRTCVIVGGGQGGIALGARLRQLRRADDHRRAQPAPGRLVAQAATSRCACTTRSGTTTCRTSSSRRTGRCSRPRTRSATGSRCTRA